MVYFGGFKTKVKKDIWAGKFQCSKCGKISNYHLYKVRNYGYVFWIPVIAQTVKRLLVCDTCHVCMELSKTEYDNVRVSQEMKLKNGEFPDDVVINDFSPSETKYGGKILLLVLVSLYSFIMTVGSIGMAIDIPVWDVSVLFGVVFTFAMGVLPLIVVIKSVVSASFKRKLYSSVCMKKKGRM